MQFLILLSLLFFANTTNALVYFQVDSENYSEAFVYKDSNAAFRQPGEKLYSHMRVEAGVFLKGFSIGYLDRLDAIATFSKDAALLYAQSTNNSDEIDERVFNVKLNANRVRTQGLTASFKDRVSIIDYKVTLDLGKTTQLLYGSLKGQMDYRDDDLSGTAQLDYYYDTDLVYNRRNAPPEGFAVGLSLSFSLNFEDSTHKLKIKDAFYQAHWDKAPHTIANLNTERIGGTDENGKFIIRPLGSGKESFRELTQRLPARFYLENSWQAIDSFSGLFHLDYIIDSIWPKAGIGYQYGNHKFEWLYGIEDISLGFNHHWKDNYGLKIQMDNLNYEEAHRINLSIYLTI